MLLEALSRVRRALGEDVFIVGCFDQSPFSLACALLEISEAMVKVIDEPDLLLNLMERCIEYSVAYARALAAAGADMLSTGDSPAGLLGPEQYREIALPAERRVFNALEATGKFRSLHICGDARHILADMATAGSDVLELDYAIDMGEVCASVPAEIAVWGNLDPVGVLARGTPESVGAEARRVVDAVVRAGRRRFVLSSGCTLTTNTPSANLHALMAAARE